MRGPRDRWSPPGGRSPLGLSLLLCLAAGCSAPQGRTVGPEDHRGLLDEIRVREVDRREDLPFFAALLAHESGHVRAAAARALGRIQKPSATRLLCDAAVRVEESQRVLAEIAFALGQIHDAQAFSVLDGLLDHDNAEVRAAAAEAIGKLEAPLPEDPLPALERALRDREWTVRSAAALACGRRGDARAIASLIRTFEDSGRVAAIGEGESVLKSAAVAASDCRWRAIYALMQIKDPAKHAALRRALIDPDPWVQTFAAWGLRNPPDAESISSLAGVLSGGASFWTVRVEALRTLRELCGLSADAGAAVRAVLLEHHARERHPLVREALIDALAAEGSAEAEDAISRELRDAKSPSARRAALRGLGRVAKVRALPLLRPYLGDPDPLARAAAVAGLAFAGDEAVEVLARALADTDLRVRTSATEALAEVNSGDAWKLITQTAARDDDFGVRWSVVDRLAAKKPAGWKDALAAVFSSSQAPAYWEARVTILKSLREDRDTVLPLAKSALGDSVFSVRQLAREILAEGASPEAFVPDNAESPSPPAPYPLLRREEFYGGEAPHLFLETDAGRIVIELYADDAPHHVSSIVSLARQGFYDGLIFHRVVPSFVVQGGDPRGDGSGDAGYFLPDEINRISYLRGTVGMPKSTKDDGGCQIFVTHLPTPRLDGRYTVFGRVVLGMDLIDRVEVGATIRRAWVDALALRPAEQIRD